jgi:hypothetical protein
MRKRQRPPRQHDPAFAGVARPGVLLPAGEVGPRELIELYLARIKRLNPQRESSGRRDAGAGTAVHFCSSFTRWRSSRSRTARSATKRVRPFRRRRLTAGSAFRARKARLSTTLQRCVSGDQSGARGASPAVGARLPGAACPLSQALGSGRCQRRGLRSCSAAAGPTSRGDEGLNPGVKADAVLVSVAVVGRRGITEGATWRNTYRAPLSPLTLIP